MSLSPKGKSVKNNIIHILAFEWPLTLREIYKKTTKTYNVDVTYQAVFKAVKELKERNVIVKEGKNYSLNVAWVNQVYDLADMIRSRYLDKKNLHKLPKDSHFPDPRINKFITVLGDKILNYFDNCNGCIIAVSGSGTNLGLGLKYFLKNNGKNVTFYEIDKHKPSLRKADIFGKRVLIVDSGISTGKTYKEMLRRINAVKKKYKIKDIKFAAGSDLAGLADWHVTNKPYFTVIDKDVLNVFW